jgi:NAD(P)-dependent dehydrogenase (short-subunit alcohol dehydrogenase family)
VADVWHSKTANALFAVEATKRWADDGTTVNALMPGAIRSNLQRHLDEVELDRMEARMNQSTDFEWKTPEQGASTSVLLAASPLLDGVGGATSRTATRPSPTGQKSPRCGRLRAGSRGGRASLAGFVGHAGLVIG